MKGIFCKKNGKFKGIWIKGYKIKENEEIKEINEELKEFIPFLKIKDNKIIIDKKSLEENIKIKIITKQSKEKNINPELVLLNKTAKILESLEKKLNNLQQDLNNVKKNCKNCNK